MDRAIMWCVKLVALAVGLLAMVPETTQLTVNHPLHGVIRKINEDSGPFLGLIISSTRDEKTLLNSGSFVPNSTIPFVNIAGRKFNIGKFNGNVPAIYVFAGQPMSDVGVTVQILIDAFHIKGIINYGAAATISSDLDITDVIVPAFVAHSGIWTWESYPPSANASRTYLKFGDYNAPEAGDNYLATIEFQPWQKIVHFDWLQIAFEISFTEFKVHQGLTGICSSDVYLYNEAYAKLLNSGGCDAVDTESAAVVSAATANGVPHIIVRGASNRPGVAKENKLADAAAQNVLKFVTKFIELVTPLDYVN